jgi:hypothetical protein
VIIPDGSTQLQAGDQVIDICKKKDVEKLSKGFQRAEAPGGPAGSNFARAHAAGATMHRFKNAPKQAFACTAPPHGCRRWPWAVSKFLKMQYYYSGNYGYRLRHAGLDPASSLFLDGAEASLLPGLRRNDNSWHVQSPH